MAKPDLKNILQRLPDLHQVLQHNKLDCSADAWLRIQDLLLVLARKGRLPEECSDFARLIGPIVCHTPEQQKSFPALFEVWWTGQPSEQTAPLSSPALTAAQHRTAVMARLDRTWGRLPHLLLLLLLAALLKGMWWYAQHEPISGVNPPPVSTVQKPTKDGNQQIKKSVVAIDDWAPPRRLGAWPVLPAAWKPRLQLLKRWLPWLPVLPALAWLCVYYRRRWVLSRTKRRGDEQDENLKIRLPQPLFGSAQALLQLRRLNTTQWLPTHRLDVGATVVRTARQAGLFSPQYRTRSGRPSYLMLVRSRHYRDQSAALAEELAARIREQNLDVEQFRFRENPQQLISRSARDYSTYTLKQVAERFPEARLIFISEADILYHPITGRPRPWLAELANWERRAWLHAGPMPKTLGRWLWQRDILPLPLASSNLESLVRWFTETHYLEKAAEEQNLQRPLPQALTLMPERWLDPVLPYGEDLDVLFAELQHYLQADGWLLLQAIASYPEPHWTLSQALDFCLFSEADPAMREQRFRLLGRLPWIMLGYLPDYLREALLVRLNRTQRKKIYDAYSRILMPTRQSAGSGVLNLDIAVPSRRSLRRFLRDSLWGKQEQTSLDDPILLNLLLGRWLMLLDFHLPRLLAGILPAARWRLNPWPALFILLVTFGGGWSIDQAWSRWGEDGITEVRALMQRWQHKDVAVELRLTPETRLLGLSLQTLLTEAGFSVSIAGAKPLASEKSQNSLRYSQAAANAAGQLAAIYQHLTYGAYLPMQRDENIQGKQLRLQLNRTYQAATLFQDRLLNAVVSIQPDKTAIGQNRPVQVSTALDTQRRVQPFSVFRDRLADDRPAPAMIALPGGSFIMGSPDGEPDRDPDEGPQHSVAIPAFAIGRYEVTFAEYDAYVERIQQHPGQLPKDCKKPALPDDSGWGRGYRPVIHVNFAQAQCYSRWLSAQTGQTYRLPSEAQWEYAARGGSAQSYFWGESADAIGLYAWFGKNSTVQTHPVGRKRPNAFGLYDTAGNTWEWTEDCWHAGYKGAPVDGSAWLEAGQGDCDRRLVRGGSWYDDPRLLRSAIRVRYITDVANDVLGFRVARAL